MSTIHEFPVAHAQGGTPAASAGKGPWINITPFERGGRIAIGLLGAFAGVLLLLGAASVLAVVLEVLLVLAGLDLVVTGALGHCPLYAKLGYVPKSLRGTYA